MVRAIDHIVIAVNDLATASADYEKAGFTVTPGGEHTGGDTHNALVSFGDGAYFELIAFKVADPPQDHKWWAKLAQGEGTVDYALLSDGLAAEAERLRQAGVTVQGPRDGGRTRPDDQRITWKTIGLEADDVPLPFVIEDGTAHDLRVPPGAATQHPLGVSGVAGLVILVPNLERAAERYEALLGSGSGSSAPEIAGVSRGRRFAFGSQFIELAEPYPNATDLQQHITQRGAGPYEIVLAGGNGKTASLPVGLTHHARIRVEPVAALAR